jgi:hypothetical protein
VSIRRLRIAVSDHGRKSFAFAGALQHAGHQLVPPLTEDADVLLVDADPPVLWHKRVIDFHAEAGAKVVLYPHAGGIPTLSYDGVWEPDPRVHTNFVTGVGHAELLRRLGYPAPTQVIGWTFTDDQKPFRACTDVKRVLFAPTHPNGDGSMTKHQRAQNSEVFGRLLQTPFEITVRHRGTIEDNGLWEAPGVKFVDGLRSPLTAQLQTSDAVVAAEGTFPTIAIAQGVPAVIYSEFVVALGLKDHEIIFPNRLALYEDYARYPFSCDSGDIESIVREAALSEQPIADYKRRFIGEQFHALKFVETFERIINDPQPTRIDATRSRTTVAFAEELIERPDLLRAYVDTVAPADDATLVLWAPALDADALLATAELALEKAGIDGDKLPDVLLTPLPGSPQTEALLAERATAVLSGWPAVGGLGALPRFPVAALSA